VDIGWIPGFGSVPLQAAGFADQSTYRGRVTIPVQIVAGTYSFSSSFVYLPATRMYDVV